MNIAVFLTFDYSFKTWVDSGTFDKELRIYQELSSKYNINFTFFSYGDDSKLN